MTIKTVARTFNELPAAAERTITTALTKTILDHGPLPPFLTIPGLDAASAGEFLRHQAPKRDRFTVHLTPHGPTLPATLARVLSPLHAAYQQWQTETIIQRNFSDNTLSTRLHITFTDAGYPDTVSLELRFDVWGLPESGIPSFNEVIPPTAHPATTQQSRHAATTHPTTSHHN